MARACEETQMKDHVPDCAGWEDCNCFSSDISHEERAALEECAKLLKVVRNTELLLYRAPYLIDNIDAALARLENIK